MYYTINDAFHHQRCITKSIMNYIINTALHHQRCIINAALHHQRWSTLSTIHSTINPSLLLRMNYIINPVLYYQLCITSLMANCTTIDAFHYQRSITLPTMSYIINTVLHHQRCFSPATLLYIVNDSHAIHPVFKNRVIPHWTLTHNAMLYNQILSNK